MDILRRVFRNGTGSVYVCIRKGRIPRHRHRHIVARILADTSDTRDFLKLFLWQAEQGSRQTRRYPRDDPRENVGDDVGVVVCGLKSTG